MNITDVDDKTIKGANKEGISLKEYTKRYENAFFEDIETLNIDKADKFPRATDHIPEMVSIIKELLKYRIAYKSEDGSIYYNISKFNDYGKLSHTKIMDLKEGTRVKHDSYEKEEAKDFALWKSYDKEDGNVFWETVIELDVTNIKLKFKGRPGWHIECSAMSMKYLGESFDIHTGGIDLVFPHHENEIAQSEASTNKKFVNYWIHNEHLLVDGHKMSKSLGNFYTLRDLLSKGYNPKAIRYLLLSINYRQQLNFKEDVIGSSEHAIERLKNFMIKLKEIKDAKKSNIKSAKTPSQKDSSKKIFLLIKNSSSKFENAMDDDLNISVALSYIFEFVNDINTLIMEDKISKNSAKKIIDVMMRFDSVLGILKEKEEILSPEIKKLINEREKARKERDFKKADEIREELSKKGIGLEDTKTGVRVIWTKKIC